MYAKAIVSVFIWCVVAFIAGTGLLNSGSINGLALTVIIFISFLSAALATMALWVPQVFHESVTVTDEVPEKAKHVDSEEARLRMLMELMDDDEREAFKQTLKQRMLDADPYADGELPLSSFLDDEASRLQH